MSKKKPTQREIGFSEGYFCAVASLLKMEGGASTHVTELFNAAGGVDHCDEIDKAEFRKHGLLKESK